MKTVQVGICVVCGQGIKRVIDIGMWLDNTPRPEDADHAHRTGVPGDGLEEATYRAGEANATADWAIALGEILPAEVETESIAEVVAYITSLQARLL